MKNIDLASCIFLVVREVRITWNRVKITSYSLNRYHITSIYVPTSGRYSLVVNKLRRDSVYRNEVDITMQAPAI